MEIEEARTFRAIVAAGSLLDAARRRHVTQSAFGARMQRLETDLGVKLLLRNRSDGDAAEAN